MRASECAPAQKNPIPNIGVSLVQNEGEEEEEENKPELLVVRPGITLHGMGVERKLKRIHLNLFIEWLLYKIWNNSIYFKYHFEIEIEMTSSRNNVGKKGKSSFWVKDKNEQHSRGNEEKHRERDRVKYMWNDLDSTI